jgi:hypothetical protein
MRSQTADCRLQIGRGLACLAVCVLVIAGAARRGTASEIIDRVLAVVSGHLIMLSDLNAARDLHLMDVPTRELLPRLIDRALIFAEVERYAPPEPGAEAVDRRVQAVRASFPTAQAYEIALARVGFDEKHLRERIRQDLRIAAYLDQRFTVQAPSDEDLGRYYREHLQDFTQDGTLTAFEQARPRVVEAATAERRQRLVDEWVAGLRRRAEIVEPPAASDVAPGAR